MSDKFIEHPHPKAKNFIALTDREFGRLTVISYAGKRGCGHYWNCQCSCGNTAVIRRDGLKSGRSTSCGCYNRDKQITHGMDGTPEYSSWHAMKNRCLGKWHVAYYRYGGRGISICDRWLDFKNFYADMGPRPSLTHTLDRINNNGNYEKSNCRWATKKEQARNRKLNKRNKTGISGVQITESKKYLVTICADIGRLRFGPFLTLEEAAEARAEAERKYWS